MHWYFGSFHIDGENGELLRNGQLVATDPKAIALIQFFAEHPNRVISRKELLRGVWQGITVSDSSINYTVMLARRAIGMSSDCHIQTLRGRGYRFAATVTREALVAAQPKGVAEHAPAAGVPSRAVVVEPDRGLACLLDHLESALRDRGHLVLLTREVAGGEMGEMADLACPPALTGQPRLQIASGAGRERAVSPSVSWVEVLQVIAPWRRT
jgi:DNA-binding winged helix-turn-helix (wHTH) protein